MKFRIKGTCPECKVRVGIEIDPASIKEAVVDFGAGVTTEKEKGGVNGRKENKS